MAGKDVNFRQVESVALPSVAGITRTRIGLNNSFMQSLNLFLKGTMTITTHNAGAWAGEGLLSLIRNIALQAVGNDRRRDFPPTFKNADFAAMYTLNNFLRNTFGKRVTPANRDIQAATPFQADVQLDFQFPHSESPRQTLLNTNELDSLDLVITWGDDSDVVVPDTGSVTTFPNTSCIVSAREILPGTDPKEKEVKYGINRLDWMEQAVPATVTRQIFNMKTGNSVRGWLIKAFTRTAYTMTPDDAIINKVSLEINGNKKIDFQNWSVLQGQNIFDYRMDSCPVGYAFIDLMEDGRFDKMLNTVSAGIRSVELVFDVTTKSNAYIRVYPVEIIPVAQKR